MTKATGSRDWIVVTGGAGFIGSQLIRALNARGFDKILVVDDLDASKVENLASVNFADMMSVRAFGQALERDTLGFVPATIFHQGACSDTMVTDGDYVLANNYDYSKAILHTCLHHDICLVYASSASVYGDGLQFAEARENENPLNLYALSKWMFDQYVRHEVLAGSGSPKAPVFGFRYFNVYGPGENHKGRMASVAWHFSNQYRSDGKVRLFEGTGGYANGEQRRDFIYVDDIVSVNLAAMDGEIDSGIFNVGTGRCQSFNDVAGATVNAWRKKSSLSPLTLPAMIEQGVIEYIEFPAALKGKYQSYTEADITHLRAAGYAGDFAAVEQGVAAYVDQLGEPHSP